MSESIGKSHVYFTIQELYKGNVEQEVDVNFDALTSCMMSFSEGEKWLIYANFQRFDDLEVSICGHSRKSFKNTEQDYYQLTAGRTFEEERLFLKELLSVQSFKIPTEIINLQNNYRPHNIQPSAINKLWLLSISFLVMIIVFFVTKKKM